MDEPAHMEEHRDALAVAHAHALAWLDSLDERRVPASASIEDVVRLLGPDLPDGPSEPAAVVDRLAEARVSLARPGRARVSVSNWSTTEEDVARSLAALRRVVGG